MHGLVNRTIQVFVSHTYSASVWEEVTRAAGLSFSEFEAMLPYRDTYTPKLLDAAAQVLDRTRDDLMEDIGTFIVSHPGFEAVRRLLRFSGDDFVDFLHSLDELDDRVRLAVADLNLPKVELHTHGEGEFDLHCNAPIAGYGHVMMGVLRAMADDYGALAVLTYRGRAEEIETVGITLVQNDFSMGRAFELGAGCRMTTLPDSAALDVLCPMHVLLDAEGIIRHAGPTMRKMRPELAGGEARFFDVFDIKRPRAITAGAELAAVVLSKIHLKFRSPPHTGLKGILVPIDHAPGYLVLNLSFGISIVDGVRDFALTNADFAVTDLATEMLYLVEAKTAAMEASYRLNCRLQGAKIAAEEQAFTDTLTGLKNRRALETVLRRLLAGKKSFAMMNIDLDYFKAVNDTLGHAAGDHVLQRAAQIMVSQTRRADTVARVGGDEFSIVLPNVAQQDVLHNIGARIIRELEKPISFQGTDCNISASIGTVCIHDGAAPAMEEVLADADVALYASKNAGRATQTLYSPSLREAANVVSPPRDRRQPPR